MLRYICGVVCLKGTQIETRPFLTLKVCHVSFIYREWRIITKVISGYLSYRAILDCTLDLQRPQKLSPRASTLATVAKKNFLLRCRNLKQNQILSGWPVWFKVREGTETQRCTAATVTVVITWFRTTLSHFKSVPEMIKRAKYGSYVCF